MASQRLNSRVKNLDVIALNRAPMMLAFDHNLEVEFSNPYGYKHVECVVPIMAGYFRPVDYSCSRIRGELSLEK